MMKKMNLEKVMTGKAEIPAVLKKKLLGGAVVENVKASAENQAVQA